MSRVKKGNSVERIKFTAKKDKSEFIKKLFSLFMVLLLAGSLIGGFLFSGFQSSGQTEYYNKHKFIYSSEQYIWQYVPKGMNEKFDFDYHPKDLETIEIEGNVISQFNNYNVYLVASDPNTPYAQEIQYLQYKMGNVFTKALEKYTGLAFTNESGYEEIPIMDCDSLKALHAIGNSTDVGIVTILESDNVGYRLDDGCIFIEGRTIQDIRMLSDLYLYSLMGIYD